MRKELLLLVVLFTAFASSRSSGQAVGLTLPDTIRAGSVVSISSSGSGSGTLYIIGFDKVLKKSVELGSIVKLPAGTLVHAGHYLAILSSATGIKSTTFDVLPSEIPAKIAFLVQPSRLPVALHDGVTGTVYVFDRFGNLVVNPTSVSFQLTTPTGSKQTATMVSRDGAAWTRMNTTARQGHDSFMARAGDVSDVRVVQQVAGDPCQLSMTVQATGSGLQLQTAPVRDCSGNPVPDGTIVTFSEAYNGGQSTADVPLKHGIAKAELPAHPGSVLSVASGVVLGNQIRWGK